MQLKFFTHFLLFFLILIFLKISTWFRNYASELELSPGILSASNFPDTSKCYCEFRHMKRIPPSFFCHKKSPYKVI